jgi:hypothetical protein
LSEEQWTIVLQQDFTGGTGATSESGAPAASGASQNAENPAQRKQVFEDAGKVFAAVAGVSGILALLIRGMKDSVIFSTAFNSIMSIFSAIADLILVAFWPVIMVVIQALLEFLPIASNIGKFLAPYMQKIAAGLDTFFKTGDSTQLIDATFKFMNDTVKVIGDWLRENTPQIMAGVQNFLKGIGNILIEIYPLIQTFIKDLFPIVTSLLMDMFNYIVSFIHNYSSAQSKYDFDTSHLQAQFERGLDPAKWAKYDEEKNTYALAEAMKTTSTSLTNLNETIKRNGWTVSDPSAQVHAPGWSVLNSSNSQLNTKRLL